jgi:hypothetical protein
MTPPTSTSARTPGITTRRMSRRVHPMVSARRTMPHIIRRHAVSTTSSFMRWPDRKRWRETGAMSEPVAAAPSTTVVT